MKKNNVEITKENFKNTDILTIDKDKIDSSVDFVSNNKNMSDLFANLSKK
ncbi:hypothetical protein [Spiroplasma apis]|nr:hypothetical protein [Spiroplasma apis]